MESWVSSKTIAIGGLLGVALATAGAAAIPDLRQTPLAALCALGLALVSAGLCLKHLAALDRRHVFFALVVVHCVALVGAPSLSDDIYRYVHEGRASRVGLGVPYAIAPNAFTPPPDDGITARVNHPEIPAAYPPATQLLFLVVAALSDAIASPFFGFRVVFLVADLLVMGILYTRCRRRDAYAWWGLHPLPILEAALSAHVDIVGVLLVTAALFLSRRALLRGLLVGLAIGFKPIAALVVLGTPLRASALARAALGAILSFGLCAVPYVVTQTNVFSGLFEYSTRWESQPTGYAAIAWPLETAFAERHENGVWTHVRFSSSGIALEEAGKVRGHIGSLAPGKTLLVDGRFFARGIALGVLLLLFGIVVVSVRDSTTRVALAFLAFFAITPTVHPWYWLWVLPFACAADLRAVWAAAALAPLAYEAAMRFASTGTWEEAWWPRGVLLMVFVVAARSDVVRLRAAASDASERDEPHDDTRD